MFKIWDEGIDETLGSLFSGAYDLLLGRRTYDIFAAYWPYAEGENAAMGEAFDRANKYVLTRGDQPLEWQNSHRDHSRCAQRPPLPNPEMVRPCLAKVTHGWAKCPVSHCC